MKQSISLIAVLALLLTIGHGVAPETTDEEDGGVRHYVDTNAPKEIESTQIVSFACEFSTLNLATDLPVAGCIYTLEATETEGSYEIRTREGICDERSFAPEPGFLVMLQKIVSEYDFAQHNGQFYSVSGLPPGYGMELNIQYASGESILMSDNQSCFLSVEAMEKLIALFRTAEQY